MTTDNEFTVLVVDDSPVARKLVELTLPSEEYLLLFAKTGAEALDFYTRYRPALVITDWLMPDFSGVELCQRIREESRDYTYIILLSGVSDKAEVVRGLLAGADDYLTKPFHPEELLARASVGRRTVALHREIELKNRQLEQLVVTDALTGMPNRRAMEEWAGRQLSGAMRHGFSFWAIMADLDNFKSINDTCGHSAGDTVLKRFAEIMMENIRRCDMCARFGGEEFLIILTHVDLEGVVRAVEHVRKLFEAYTFTFGKTVLRVTASFGVAALPNGSHMSFEELISRADAALYTAKHKGRNMFQVAPMDQPPVEMPQRASQQR
jgi:diguanylate cyclase (GGDEF)-like protein